MAATYAHITLVNLASAEKMIKGVINKDAFWAIYDNLEILELGSISPDYPALSLFHNNQTLWTALFHNNSTGGFINIAAQELSRMTANDEKQMLFAWLAGYLAHIVTDGIIHPVVNLKVGGPYSEQKLPHIMCEMFQDNYIYQRLNIGSIPATNEHLRNSITYSNSSETELNNQIVQFWDKCLRLTFEKDYSNTPPEINYWHEKFTNRFENIVDETAGRLISCSRHSCNEEVEYPNSLDDSYIYNLQTPINTKHSYDDIFNMAIENVIDSWKKLGRMVYEGSDYRFEEWDADTGITRSGEFKFWRA